MQEQQELTNSAALSLISSKKTEKEKLTKKFEDMKGLFSTEFRKDHKLIKAQQKIQNEQNFRNKCRTTVIPDQRQEIIEYYEMNQKLIENSKNDVDQKEMDYFFKDVKKINSQIVNNKKMENLKTDRSTTVTLNKTRSNKEKYGKFVKDVNIDVTISTAGKSISNEITKPTRSIGISIKNKDIESSSRSRSQVKSKSPMKFK